MKNLLLVIPVFLLATFFAFAQDYEDVVYLNNGSIIHGTIIEQVPNVSIKIKTKDGNIFVYRMEEIEKMTKEEFKREKKHRETPTSNSYENRSGSNYSGFGVRGGVGTDISLGIGFGAGAFYVMAPNPYSSSCWDLGLDFYYANVSEEETDREGTAWEGKTELFVIAMRTNGLFNYHPKKTGFYFVAGAGLVLAIMDWAETYTYGPPIYSYSFERYSDEAFGVGNVLNLGVGMTFGGGLETRLETPLLIFYNAPSAKKDAASIAPTFTFNVLYRFP
jgi:hypothetical protein